MKKNQIIKKSSEFSNIISLKKIFANKIYSIYIESKKEEINRYGISVPTKIGKAIIRNKLKRQIKDIIDKNIMSIEKKYDYIIIVKKGILDLSYLEMEKNLFHLLDIIKKEGIS